MYIFADLLTLCFHEAGVRSEVALLFLYLFQILWFLSEVGVFTFVMKDLDVYRALLSLGSETRIDRVSVGFQVEFVVSGLLLILLFKSIFPSRQTQRQQPYRDCQISSHDGIRSNPQNKLFTDTYIIVYIYTTQIHTYIQTYISL